MADTDAASREWQEEFEGTLLERDMPQLGISIPAAALGRFWLMLTHYHARVWKGSELARLFVIHPGKDSCEMIDQTEAVGIADLRARLAQAGIGGQGRAAR